MNTDSERGIPVNPDQTAVEIYVQDHVAPEKGDQTFALTLDDQHVVGTGRKQMRDPSKLDIGLGDDGQTLEIDPVKLIRARRRKLIASDRDLLPDQCGGLVAVITAL